jgi:hypothetical protein
MVPRPFKRATTLPRIYSTKEPARRFGATAIKCHPFFNGGVNWALLLWCTTAPYVPLRRPPMALDQGGSTRPHLGHGTGRRRRHSCRFAQEAAAVDLMPPRFCRWRHNNGLRSGPCGPRSGLRCLFVLLKIDFWCRLT